MSSYRGINLFASGPHEFHVHGLSQRHQIVEQPDTDGVRIVPLGRTPRTIEQSGTLSAQQVAGLDEQLGAIEALIDGVPGELTDDLGRRWPRMVLLDFRLGPVNRTGLLLTVRYDARYLQVNTDLLPKVEQESTEVP